MIPRPFRVVLGVTAEPSLKLVSPLATALTERGWDVHVVASSGQLLDSRAQFHAIPMERELAILRDLRALFAWVQLLRRIQPDAVMVGTPKAGLLGILASVLTRVPQRVYHLRGLRLETTKGWRRRLLRLLEYVTCHGATAVLSVSRSLARRVAEERIIPASRVHVLGEGSSKGVDLNRYTPAPTNWGRDIALARWGLNPDLPVVGFVGRLHPDKGIKTLVAAISALHHVGQPCQLLLVGRDEGTVLDLPQEIVDHVRVTGYLSDPREAYWSMDIFCLPSEREGFPNCVLEAAASALPSVVSDATGCVDSVVDGRTGIVVPVGHHELLAGALQSLIENVEFRRATGIAARNWVLANFRAADVLRAHADFLAAQVRVS